MKRLDVLELKREEIYDTINGIETRIENLDSRKKKEQKSILESISVLKKDLKLTTLVIKFQFM
jgi:hypothetical protein